MISVPPVSGNTGTTEALADRVLRELPGVRERVTLGNDAETIERAMRVIAQLRAAPVPSVVDRDTIREAIRVPSTDANKEQEYQRGYAAGQSDARKYMAAPGNGKPKYYPVENGSMFNHDDEEQS